MRPKEHSGRDLAYLGDAVWSLKIRQKLIELGYGGGKRLQSLTVKRVSAKAQAMFYDAMHEEGFFSEEEEEMIHRGRNDNAGTVPRNTDVSTYRKSTGFEAVLGYLQLEQREQRIDEIVEKAFALSERL
ncbi:MAG: Mini-ribonuclease 3 [Solobacterium sp.]|nr:Mini-ribonuclease 3 [Solobacterium sp.]